MTKRKVNVLSNELDQAPKTRAAGYGKVVNSMRKEINEAMDRIFLNGSDVIASYMNHTDKIPVKQLLELEPGGHLSFEVKREKTEPSGGFIQTVGHAAFLGDFNNFSDHCFMFEKEGPLKPGEKSLIIVVEKDAKDSKTWKVHAEQLEFPGKGAMLMQGMFFHNPNVSDEKFQEIVGAEDKKEDIKEQIKENINEEIEIEENEEKEEKKAEEDSKQQKKSLGDTIKGWFK